MDTENLNAIYKDERPYEYRLPTTPCPEIGPVLVTGASGYVGGRLVPALLRRGYQVRAMFRNPTEARIPGWENVSITAGDALNVKSLVGPLAGVHTAYYLIHSLALGSERFGQADIEAAVNFRRAAEACGVSRIIYLGGLGDLAPGLSEHLESRMKVAFTLGGGKVPVTVLRAAIIIGSGSASYEIIHSLVTRLRFIPAPRFAANQCQPISIRDVVKYLIGVLENPQTSGQSYDIGGQDILSYREMMLELARLLNRRIGFFRSPVSSIRPYSYIASLVTPVPSAITASLMEGLRNDVVCQNFSIRQAVPFEPIGYREALVRAMDREEQDQVRTRWSDAYPPAHELAIKLKEMRRQPRYTASYSLNTAKPAHDLFQAACRIGGTEGWFHSNWLWRLRGFLDRLLGGVGTLRGRKRAQSLQVGDVIDFWRVEALVPDQVAEM